MTNESFTKTANPILGKMPDYVLKMQAYRPGKPIEELKEELGFDRIIKLASNENPFGASPLAQAAVKQHLDEVFRYPDPVSRKLRRKIATRLGVQVDEILVGAGSESLLSIAVRALMKPGETVVTGFGAFMGMAIHLSSHGGVLQAVPSPEYRFDVDAIIKAVTPETRIVYLPNPNNPTGSYVTHEELSRLIDAVPATTLLLVDEAYIEFCDHLKDFPDAIELRKPNVLIMRTFSKAYGLAGHRVGYAIGDSDLIEQFGKVKLTFEPTLTGQVAAEAAWEDSEFLKRGIENNRSELEKLYQVFDELSLRYVRSAGNFVLIEMNTLERVAAVNEGLLKQGIAIRPLAAFGFPTCFRVSIGLPQENAAFVSALKEILPTLPSATA